MATLRLQRAEGIVLRTTPFRETSLVGALFTRQLGRISFIARGARRPGKEAGAALQATNVVSCSVYLGSNPGLRTLAGIETIGVHEGIARSPVHLGLAAYASELILTQLPEEDPSPRVYELLRGYLGALNDASPQEGERALLAFEYRLQRSLGYGLRIDSCARCGAPLEGPLAVSPKHGGLVCSPCGAQDACLEALGKGDLDVLRAMLSEPFARWRRRPASPETIAVLARIARRMWEMHTPAQVRSKSLAFLAEVHAVAYRDDRASESPTEPST